MLKKVKKGIQNPREVPPYVRNKLIRNFPLIYRTYIIKKNRHLHRYEAVSDPLKFISVDPSKIDKATNKHFTKHEHWGRILGGDWDRDTHYVIDSAKFDSLIDRFQNNKDWEQTSLYEKYTNRREMSHEEVISHLERYDRLYSEMQKRYKTSFELPSSEFMEDVSVCISREGQILFSRNGRHRLALAKILELDEIPVRVMVRHKEWQNIKDSCQEQINRYEELTGEYGQFSDHPDIMELYDDQIRSSFG